MLARLCLAALAAALCTGVLGSALHGARKAPRNKPKPTDAAAHLPRDRLVALRKRQGLLDGLDGVGSIVGGILGGGAEPTPARPNRPAPLPPTPPRATSTAATTTTTPSQPVDKPAGRPRPSPLISSTTSLASSVGPPVAPAAGSQASSTIVAVVTPSAVVVTASDASSAPLSTSTSTSLAIVTAAAEPQRVPQAVQGAAGRGVGGIGGSLALSAVALVLAHFS